MTTSSFPAVSGRLTKVQVPPPRAAAIERAQLLERLERSADRRIVLLCAPAGYGKSTLAAQWSARDPRPATWLHLDATDNDPVVLLNDLADALAELEPLGAALTAELAARGPRSWTRVLALLDEELARRRPFQLVLDDLHLLTNAAAVETVSLVVERFPVDSQLVLSTRTEPRALRVARLRASGELLGLRAPDLALTPRETAALAGRSGLGLESDQVSALHARSEGWAAGVALALLSWDGAADAGGQPGDEIDERAIASYLLEEVLDRQPERLRSFLLETSVLQRLCAPLCDAVLGRTDSARHLAELEQSNMFVVPLDRHEHWYRYHHLFGDLLRAELERRSPELVTPRLAAAAAWHEDHGDPEEGLAYAHASGDVQRAGRIAWQHANTMLAQGRMETLRSWADRCTDEDVEADTQLALLVGWVAMLTGDAAGALRASVIADRGADLDGPSADGASSLRSAVATLRGTIAPDGIGQMLDDGLLCCDLERATGGEPLIDSLRMVGTAHLLAGRPEQAIAALSEARSMSADRPELAHLDVHCLGLLALAEGDLGNWAHARRWAREAMSIVERSGLQDSIVSLPAFTAHAQVLQHEGLLARVPADLEQIARLAPALRALRWFEAEIGLRCASLCLGIGDVPSALQHAETVRAALSGYPDAAALTARLEQLDRRIASGRDLDLTPSEIRLVPFLPSHLSLQEIGSRVHLSRATIKTHVSSIYRKLGVSTRSQAVERIEELGLGAPRVAVPPGESPVSGDAAAHDPT